MGSVCWLVALVALVRKTLVCGLVSSDYLLVGSMNVCYPGYWLRWLVGCIGLLVGWRLVVVILVSSGLCLHLDAVLLVSTVR